MTPREKAKICAKILDEKMARELKILEVTDLTTLADFFVIATATSVTHLKTLSDHCEITLKNAGELPGHIEGSSSSTWILMDYGSVIVHLFLEESRQFYSLERLWADAKQWNEEDL